MGARIGKVVFSDWKTIPFDGGWTDTFIFRMSALACLPPFAHASLIRRMAAPVRKLRKSASIWVQVDAPGKWYEAEVRRSLRGLQLPVAVTGNEELEWTDFSYRPWLGVTPCPPPPFEEEAPPSVSADALLCLQALGRMVKGNEHEVAALAGLSISAVQTLLPCLEQQRLVVFKTSKKILRCKSRPAQIDLFPSWHLSRLGLSVALRSWGVPPNLPFPSRLERNLYQIGSEHRHIARIWPAWLQSAWPQAEIWTGWSEVRISGLSVVPDALAWGKIQGSETLFWLEVGEEHKSREQIRADIRRRLDQATTLSERTGVRLIFVLLSSRWVREEVRWAAQRLPQKVTTVMGSWSQFGELPQFDGNAPMSANYVLLR
jgi:hypothetical protein